MLGTSVRRRIRIYGHVFLIYILFNNSGLVDLLYNYMLVTGLDLKIWFLEIGRHLYNFFLWDVAVSLTITFDTKTGRIV